MELPKYRIEEIKRMGKAADIAHRLYCKYKDYLINDLDLDVNLVIDNLNSLINDDMSSADFISVINEELEDR